MLFRSFQGPFQAIHVDRDEYLIHLSRYIHLNPGKAGLVRAAEDWEYSSYREYVGLRAGSLPKPQIVLEQFAKVNPETPETPETRFLAETGFLTAQQAYRRFVESYADKDREVIAHLVRD